jgi:pantoate--beta-alanine ligase
MKMNILKTAVDLKDFCERTRRQQMTFSFVPTMGALHEGHLSLVRQGQQAADICLPYIFVNPRQFAPHEDLDSYPRTMEADLEKLSTLGVEHVFVPSVEEVYPAGFQTTVKAGAIAAPLEGEFRPHFFDGVCTVVCRMLMLALPNIAIFGQKDFQQLQVIRRMVADLAIPVEILAGAIVRDENGLALSSRNRYLSDKEYEVAVQLNKTLSCLAAGELNEDGARQALLYAGFDKVDYVTLRNSGTFKKENADRALAAAWIGKTRLIDNMPMNA